MYVETRWPDNRMKSGRIARVQLSKTGRTLYLDGKSFIALGRGEFMESESHESCWFSAPRKDGNDRRGVSLSVPIEIDEDAREEYWTRIHGLADRADQPAT